MSDSCFQSRAEKCTSLLHTHNSVSVVTFSPFKSTPDWRVFHAQDLAGSFADADELAKHAYDLYSEFRPQIAQGQAGWGKPGLLDLQKIRDLHK